MHAIDREATGQEGRGRRQDGGERRAKPVRGGDRSQSGCGGNGGQPFVPHGLTNDEIADQQLHEPSHSAHLWSMTKLGARDRTQLVVHAYESGLVRPGWLA